MNDCPCDDATPMEICPGCEKGKLTVETGQHLFPYGPDGPDQITLTCEVTIYHCPVCDDSFLDHVGEDAREAAVQKYRAALEAK